MPISNRLSRYAVIAIVVGAYVPPFISHGFFPEDLQKIHEESAQQREERREQFRQNILEKRREMISKWHGRTQELKEKFFKEGGQEITSGFEIRQSENTRMLGSSSAATTTPEQEEPKKESFFSAVKKRVNDITHLFSQFGNLLSGN